MRYFFQVYDAIKKPNRSMLFNPSSDAVIKVDDTAITVGEKENLQELKKILNP
jgi:K+/H+ antiporter YhaU regulatory subunit KhtT